MKDDLAFALLTPEQVRRICVQGGRVELSFAYEQKGAYPFRRGMIFLERPASVAAFCQALFHEGAILGPGKGHGGIGAAEKLFVCGFVNHENGAFLVSSIHVKSSPAPIP
jgi:hypothetical protein